MLVNYFGYLNHTKIFNLLFISLHQELILETSIEACESTKLENRIIMFFVQFVAPIPCTETGKVIVNKFSIYKIQDLVSLPSMQDPAS